MSKDVVDLAEVNGGQNLDIVNKNLTDTQVRLFGDQTTIAQIVQLLAYIRHAIKYNMQAEIKVKIGNKVINTPLALDVNGQEIKDFVCQPEAEIN